MTEGFEPKLVGFLCNWCSYAGADLAGAVDTVYINRALLEGADGVLVAGCHLGDCHYQNGNYKARRRMALLKNINRTLGLDEERVWVKWISASEGQRFADTVKDMVEGVKELGPNPASRVWNV
ncbi:MAG: hydrogenase iron-sulfur subunit [Candidatus Thermoplasmatota archaeon]|nr:hydrogenase iron-sulfur subunit [Candidatus Thermoplasmatota archaeon]